LKEEEGRRGKRRKKKKRAPLGAQFCLRHCPRTNNGNRTADGQGRKKQEQRTVNCPWYFPIVVYKYPFIQLHFVSSNQLICNDVR